MAFQELHMRTGGSNLNSGGTNADAASITEVNGSWDVTAETFIATAATPFAAVAVGDWVSIYLDAASATPFISRVTSINLSGLSITVSTTEKWGTKPAAGATGRSCKVGGAFANYGITGSGMALNVGTAAISTRINIMAGTYANTTSSRTFALIGTTLFPVVWRGFNTTPGDIDANNTLAKPAITFTTGQFLVTQAHQTFENLDISGAQTTNAQVRVTHSSGLVVFYRCRIECTAANANGKAFETSGNGVTEMVSCWMKATTTASAVWATTNGEVHITHTTVVGGLIGLSLGTRNTTIHCTIRDAVNQGILSGVAGSFVYANVTISGCGSDGIRVSVIPAMGLMMACTITRNGGYGTNNSTGANTNFVTRTDMDYGGGAAANTSGEENGFGDNPSRRKISETGDPLTSTSNFTMVAGALGKGAALGVFENEVYRTYLDAGAVQRQEICGKSARNLTTTAGVLVA